MADTLYSLPISSLTSKKPESSDKFISYDDTEKQAHVTTAGDLAETLNENISDAFSSGNSYSAGDYCIYNDTLYKFTADHSGAWDNDDVEAVTVGGELNELNTNSLSYHGTLTSSDDLNNVTEQGTYTCGSADVPQNSPASNVAFAFLIFNLNSVILQIAVRYNVDNMQTYYRVYHGAISEWRAWRQITTTAV